MLKIFIKIIASAFMILSGYFFGKSFENNMKLRYETLLKLSEAIYFLKAKICTDNFDLPEALKETGRKYCDEDDSVFNIAAVKLINSDESAETIWTEAVNQSQESIYLKAEDKEVIKKAGTLLGVGDVQVQQDNLQELISKLDALAETAQEKMKKEGALYIKIGLAVGSVIAVLMW